MTWYYRYQRKLDDDYRYAFATHQLFGDVTVRVSLVSTYKHYSATNDVTLQAASTAPVSPPCSHARMTEKRTQSLTFLDMSHSTPVSSAAELLVSFILSSNRAIGLYRCRQVLFCSMHAIVLCGTNT